MEWIFSFSQAKSGVFPELLKLWTFTSFLLTSKHHLWISLYTIYHLQFSVFSSAVGMSAGGNEIATTRREIASSILTYETRAASVSKRCRGQSFQPITRKLVPSSSTLDLLLWTVRSPATGSQARPEPNPRLSSLYSNSVSHLTSKKGIR